MGDSLVFLSEASSLSGTETWITDELIAGGFQAYLTGLVGVTVDFTYLHLWNQPSRQGITPDVLVVALGTNDMHVDPQTGLPLTTPEAAAIVLGTWLAEVPDACVRLVGVAESVAGWGLDVTGPGWNAMLVATAAAHANATYVAWEPLAAWTGGGSSPHLTPEGRDAYRDLLVSAATSCQG
ncbi:MAG: hypothetical protein R2707_05965 [Acidimicrobiales bacterium]